VSASAPRGDLIAHRTPGTRTDQRWWLASLSGALSVLIVARILDPDARGFGTHTQLGLPRCAFQWLTGLPCPACGLTTSFAHLARGEFDAALHANAFGVLLFACVLASVPFAMWARLRNRAFFETLARMRIERVGLLLASIGLLNWIVRIARLLLA
jgi:hypothetical protein